MPSRARPYYSWSNEEEILDKEEVGQGTIPDATGSLFGDLWHRYGDDLFENSVNLFTARFKANGFDLKWFRGKRCLDAGCGGADTRSQWPD